MTDGQIERMMLSKYSVKSAPSRQLVSGPNSLSLAQIVPFASMISVQTTDKRVQWLRYLRFKDKVVIDDDEKMPTEIRLQSQGDGQ